MTPDEVLARVAGAPELDGLTNTGRSKRDVFLEGLVGGLRDHGAHVCTCPRLDRPHTADARACLRRFAVDAAGVAIIL